MSKPWTTIIKSNTRWFDLNLKELFQYRDLIVLFVKRNYATRYKQTILGPLWLILNPLITVFLYSFVFGSIAGLSTDGVPQMAFYMASNAIWTYFAGCLTQTSDTFIANVGIYGKVYFPRLTTPISTVITGVFDLVIQIIMLLITMGVYAAQGIYFELDYSVFFIPILIIQVAILGLGCGIIISALTTKYRDLSVLAKFGVQLWMYASPVVYSIAQIPEEYQTLYLLNPMAPILTVFRHSFFGIGEIPWAAWGISWGVTMAVLMLGIIFFSKIEKTFMDTV